ncbi:MAG TPA: hypothetical protein GX505_11200 [Clostridiales bacterium]|nr:hypothetical protein [Clostridiales bacterium]
MAKLTSRERLMCAMRGGMPDRVPVAPDMSNMIPCKLTGKPFWDIYYYNNPPLWEAYLNAARTYGIDGWFTYGQLDYKYPINVDERCEIISKTKEKIVVRNTYETPKGELSKVTVYPWDNPPTIIEKLIKNFKDDFSKFIYLMQAPVDYDDETLIQQKKALGEDGIMCINVPAPGFHTLVDYFDGGLEALTYALYDYPDMFNELIDLFHKRSVKECEMALDAGTDSILTGGSGSITLSSPELWYKFSLPTIKKVTRMCREAGVISGIHSCGLEMYMVEVCAKETELDYINPLEIPPMGDCTLKTAREKAGDRLCLMGNLNTTEIMLYGTPNRVKLESLRALLDAGQKGAFVLSTGDQCGRDTPEENLLAMVNTAEEFGKYPLDVVSIEKEIKRLEEELHNIGQ